MKNKLSKFVQNISSSATLNAAARAKELRAQGYDIIDLTLGQPDFDTPKAIQKAAIASIENGKASFYTVAGGLPELKEAVIGYFGRYYGYRPEQKQILVTAGAKFALYAYFLSVLDAGDEVLIPAPYWVSYVDQTKMAGGKPVIIETNQTSSFKVTVDQLEKARTEKTKVLLLNSPSNPTGMIYSAEELRAIGEWALAHDLLILSDDIYHRLVYNGAEFTAISSLSEELQKITMVINGTSKTYSMTGWRIGLAVGDSEIIAAMNKIVSQTTSNSATVSQYAAIKAFSADDPNEKEMKEHFREAFEERLNTIYPLLAEIPGFEVVKPEGAFYFFPKVSAAMKLTGFETVADFSRALLEEAHVAVVSGEAFGSQENIRLSYATDLESLKEAVARIKNFVNQHTI